jgi:hypothetical protein
MQMSVEQLLSRIETLLTRCPKAGDAVGECRYLSLKNLQESLQQYGFERDDDVKVEACLMPFIFQELNYDEYDWSNRSAHLGQLDENVEIDVIAWSSGRRRAELTDAEYSNYLDCCHRAIELRRCRS